MTEPTAAMHATRVRELVAKRWKAANGENPDAVHSPWCSPRMTLRTTAVEIPFHVRRATDSQTYKRLAPVLAVLEDINSYPSEAEERALFDALHDLRAST